MKKEIWKDIKNYLGFYQISNFGRVKSLERLIYYIDGHIRKLKERILKLGLDTEGYYHVTLCKNNKQKTCKVHQLVHNAFGPKKPSKKHEVNHKDGNKKNNRWDNFEWVTHKENSYHAHKIGLCKGKMLSGKEMLEVQTIYSKGEVSQEFLAKKYGIVQSNIWRVIHNKIPPRNFY